MFKSVPYMYVSLVLLSPVLYRRTVTSVADSVKKFGGDAPDSSLVKPKPATKKPDIKALAVEAKATAANTTANTAKDTSGRCRPLCGWGTWSCVVYL